MSTSVPQIRALSHSDDQEPALKKQRLEISQEDIAKNIANLIEMETLDDTTTAPSVSLSELEVGTGLHPTDRKQKKKKKRRDPPLPEPCSGADVQYREVRELLGGDVVDSVTEAGNAFQSPFSPTEEVTVTIESMGSGGALSIWIRVYVTHLASSAVGAGLARAPSEKGPWAVVVPVALPGETVRVKIVKNDRMHSCGQVLEVLVADAKTRDDSLVRCKYFGSCGGCQYQVCFPNQSVPLLTDLSKDAHLRETTRTEERCDSESLPDIFMCAICLLWVGVSIDYDIQHYQNRPYPP